MIFLSFINLGLVFLYYTFSAYDVAPVGWSMAGGVFLAFLFSYLHKERSSTEIVLVALATFVVVIGIYYGYIPDGSSILKIPFATIAAIAGGVMSAVLFLTVFGMSNNNPTRFVTILAASAVTAFNSLPLVSYLWAIFAA